MQLPPLNDPSEQSQFALEMDHFAWWVLKDLVPNTPGEEGLQDQKIMEALYRSKIRTIGSGNMTIEPGK